MDNDKDQTSVISFFNFSKFKVGLFSCFYVLFILFFVGLAIILPLKKLGRIRIGDFIVIGLPAWILIAITLVIAAETGKWGIFPHWLWTSVKKIVVNVRHNRIIFVTGWWPFRSTREYPKGRISSLIITSFTIGDFKKKELFGLKILLDDKSEWIFLRSFRDETELRKKVRLLSEILESDILDKTYKSQLADPVKTSKKVPKISENFKRSIHGSAISDVSTGLKLPRGIKEKQTGEGSIHFLLSRSHEWLPYTLVLLIFIGIYLTAWVLGWISPASPGFWEFLCLLFVIIMIINTIKIILPVREIKTDNQYFLFSLMILGFTFRKKRIPLESITRITRQQTELLTCRLIIISDDRTVKVGNLNVEMADYVIEKLSRLVQD